MYYIWGIFFLLFAYITECDIAPTKHNAKDEIAAFVQSIRSRACVVIMRLYCIGSGYHTSPRCSHLFLNTPLGSSSCDNVSPCSPRFLYRLLFKFWKIIPASFKTSTVTHTHKETHIYRHTILFQQPFRALCIQPGCWLHLWKFALWHWLKRCISTFCYGE